MDQFAHAWAQSNGKTIWDHPDFPAGDSLALTRERIAAGLKIAHLRGIRVMDIQFIATRNLLQEEYASDHSGGMIKPGEWDRSVKGLAVSNEAWLLEIERFNAAGPAEPMQVRLRINATAVNIHKLFRTFRPFDSRLPSEDPAIGKIRSRIPELPQDPCFDLADQSHACYRTSRVPAGYYRSRNMDGTLNHFVPNLANPAIRRAISEWARLSIREARRVAPHTKIQEVSLSLDACSESSLFGSDSGGVVGFTRAYSTSFSRDGRTAFFREREYYLKAAYKEFAASVHSEKNLDGSPIAAGVFQQLWAFDGRFRGTFELYSLLKGTEMDVLHHTQMPLDSAQSLMAVAYSASVGSSLGMEFDTEFSWPHFGAPAPVDPGVGWLFSTANASNFLGQAKAGIRYGAHGITYCNWGLRFIVAPPAADEWRKLIGGRDPPFNQKHLEALDKECRAAPLAPAEKALFISTAGRRECEEKFANPQAAGFPCFLPTYFEWFREAGWLGDGSRNNPIFHRKIVVFTDAMVLDGKVDLTSLKEVFMPFETSLSTDSALLRALEKIPADHKRKFRWQRGPSDAGTGSFREWIETTRPEHKTPARGM